MKFKAVLFDYFGVVSSDEIWDFVHEDKQANDKFHKLAEEVNLGHMSWREYCQAVAKKSGKSVEDVNQVYEAHKLNRPLIKFVEHLKKNYRTALVTNASSEFIDPIINEAHLDHIFDAFVVSSEVGVTKPDPMIYMAAAQKLGLEPSECIFIDDVARNVDGATNVGMTAFVYEDLKQTQSQLKKLGVL